MELFEIIKKYGIINYNECSQFVPDEDATEKEFQTEYKHSTNQQFIKIYTTPGKFISIKKMHGVLSGVTIDENGEYSGERLTNA